MRCVTLSTAVICLGLATACTPPMRQAAAPTVQNGWVTYNLERGTYTVKCDQRPLLINGERLAITITGDCSNVQVATFHSDVAVDIVPGGQINITGAHNDVYWTQTVDGPHPTLADHGDANSYHRS